MTDGEFMSHQIFYQFGLYELEFYGLVKTVKVMSSLSVKLLILFVGRLSPLSTCVHTITKTSLFKYIENFTTKKMKIFR